MFKVVPSLVLLLILSLSVTAQIQKTPNNRVYVDEDYEYTELARRNRNVKEQLDRGMRFYKARDYKAAADAFASAMNWDPAVFDAHFNLGVTRLYLADYRSAVAASYYLAWSYLDEQQFPKAIEMLDECARLEPTNALVYAALAEGYYHEKRYKEALSNAQKAVDINPKSLAGYAGLGHIYFGMKKLKEAKQNFQKALTIEPESATARYNLALTCLAMNQKDCAREQYAILKHVEPDLSSQLLAQIYGSKLLRLMK